MSARLAKRRRAEARRGGVHVRERLRVGRGHRARVDGLVEAKRRQGDRRGGVKKPLPYGHARDAERAAASSAVGE
jgi:hypothetical protein